MKYNDIFRITVSSISDVETYSTSTSTGYCNAKKEIKKSNLKYIEA